MVYDQYLAKQLELVMLNIIFSVVAWEVVGFEE